MAEPAASVLRRAQGLFEHGRLIEAEEVLRQAQRMVDEEPAALGFHAFLLYKLGRAHEAEDAYRLLAALTPDDPSVFSNLGLVCFRQEKFRLAREAYEKVLDLSPGDERALRGLAQCCRRLGDASQAVEYFRRAGIDYAPAGREADSPNGCRPTWHSTETEETVNRAEDGTCPPAFPDGTGIMEYMAHFSVPPVEARRGVFRSGRGSLVWRIDEKIYVNRHFIASHRGVVVFSSTSRQADRTARKFARKLGNIVRVEGNGEIVLAGRGAGLFSFRLEEGKGLHVNYPCLVCCGPDIHLSFQASRSRGVVFCEVELAGDDLVVLALRGGPTILGVNDDVPTYVSPEAVAAWAGDLEWAHEEVAWPGPSMLAGRKESHLRFDGRGYLMLQDLPGKGA